jgi:hypothetical protein
MMALRAEFNAPELIPQTFHDGLKNVFQLLKLG